MMKNAYASQRSGKYDNMQHINQRSMDEFIEEKYMPTDMSIKLPMIPGVTDKLANDTMPQQTDQIP